ncbi:MAG: hypothetical protein LBF16_14220 [Pseudomonadales bacterium]|jgi:hypothetical protein|nr:hypothetical protein [Pseudomonadales bacterium]
MQSAVAKLLIMSAFITTASLAQTSASTPSKFNTLATIRDVMDSVVDPNADALWDSVRTEINASGAHIYQPQSDADWLALRYNAVALLEGGNALLMPGRRVAPQGAGTDPEIPYAYPPQQIEAMLEAERPVFNGFVAAFQSVAMDMLRAIDSRNVAKLDEFGEVLDQACEACHSHFWYPPIPGN